MLIQLLGRTLNSDNGGSGHLSTVTSSKLKKVIEPVLIQLVGHTIHSDNSSTLSSDNGGMGHVSKVISCQLKKSFNLC